MTYGKNFFDQPVKNDRRTYDNIKKLATGQGDDYKSSCLLNYVYFQSHYKMTTIDLSRKQALDADPKAIQQINFTGTLDHPGNTTVFHYSLFHYCFYNISKFHVGPTPELDPGILPRNFPS